MTRISRRQAFSGRASHSRRASFGLPNLRSGAPCEISKQTWWRVGKSVGAPERYGPPRAQHRDGPLSLR